MAVLRSVPLIAVRNVLASSRWYAEILGLVMLSETEEDTHGNVYNRLLSGNTVMLQLHSWDDEEHPNLMDADKASVGHGILLWFVVDDFDNVVDRVYNSDAEIVEGVHVNPGPKNREIWFRDPDGYLIVIASPDGE